MAEKIIFFSNNKNKILEIFNFFSSTSLKILSLNNYQSIKSPEETGDTFKENARIKSTYGYNIFKKICFADDSGICIEAMGGKPGINSKNFLKKHNNEKDALKSILSITNKYNNFNAFFQTSICLTLSKKTSFFFEGKVKGKISKEIRGVEGFGYDPIFIPNGYNTTFAEMSIDKKNSMSHRSIAIKKLRDFFLRSI